MHFDLSFILNAYIHTHFFRDVQCVRELFRRKYNYESEDYPKFTDLIREDTLDTEVHCTGYGFTKEMEKVLLKEYGMIEESDDEPKVDEEGEAKELDQTNDDINEYRQQLEKEIRFSEVKSSKSGNDSIKRYIESCSQYLGNIKIGPEEKIPHEVQVKLTAEPLRSKTPENHNIVLSSNLHESEDKMFLNQNDSDAQSINTNELETDNVAELANVDQNSRMYRLKMVEQLLNDARSQRSYSTTASTIAPSVITDRIKRNMDKKEKIDMRKRSVAKGEACAVHRHRKENEDVVNPRTSSFVKMTTEDFIFKLKPKRKAIKC